MQCAEKAGDSKFMLAVGVLMVLLIALLGGLWLRERNARINDVAKIRRAYEAQMPQVTPAISPMALQSMLAAPQRESAKLGVADVVAVEQQELSGEMVRVTRITAQAGARIGLEPGQVLLVSPPPAMSQPDEK